MLAHHHLTEHFRSDRKKTALYMKTVIWPSGRGGGLWIVSYISSLSDTPRSSSWWRWIPLVKLLMLEKKLDEKYFFVMEKFDFENLSMTFFLGAKIIFGKHIFPRKFLRKSQKIREKIRLFYFKNALFCRTKKFIFEV